MSFYRPVDRQDVIFYADSKPTDPDCKNPFSEIMFGFQDTIIWVKGGMTGPISVVEGK